MDEKEIEKEINRIEFITGFAAFLYLALGTAGLALGMSYNDGLLMSFSIILYIPAVLLILLMRKFELIILHHAMEAGD